MNKIDKSTALMQLDAAVFDALSIIKNKTQRQAICDMAKSAASSINEGRNPEPILQTNANYLDSMIELSSIMFKFTNEEFEPGAVKAVEAAVIGAYGLSELDSNQASLLADVISNINDGNDLQSNAFLTSIGIVNDVANLQTFLSIIKDAYSNWENVLVNESTVEDMVKYASTFDGAVIGNRAANMMAYVCKCDAAKPFEPIMQNIHAVLKAQRTPSALLANEFKQQLQNQFKDWYAAMKYGAKHAGSQYQAMIQEKLLCQNENIIKVGNEIIQLIQEIASSFSCAASITEFTNANGKKALRIKLLSSFMQADESTYSAIQTILQSLCFDITISNRQGVRFLVTEIEPCNLKTIVSNLDQMRMNCYALIDACTCGRCYTEQWFSEMSSNTVWWRWMLNLQAFLNDTQALATYAWSIKDAKARAYELKRIGSHDLLTAITLDDLSSMPIEQLPVELQTKFVENLN